MYVTGWMRRASSNGGRSCWPPTPAPATEDVAANVGVGGSTVYRTKRRFVLGNLEAALSEEPRPGADRKLSGKSPDFWGRQGQRSIDAGQWKENWSA